MSTLACIRAVKERYRVDLLLNVGGIACALLLCACTSVEPWERGNLAKPVMAPDPAPLASALRVHTRATREAAGAATFGAAGGGCGCN